jgi:hypothetical protein
MQLQLFEQYISLAHARQYCLNLLILQKAVLQSEAGICALHKERALKGYVLIKLPSNKTLYWIATTMLPTETHIATKPNQRQLTHLP